MILDPTPMIIRDRSIDLDHILELLKINNERSPANTDDSY